MSSSTQQLNSSDQREYDEGKNRNPDGRVESGNLVAEIGVAKTSRLSSLGPGLNLIIVKSTYPKNYNGLQSNDCEEWCK